MLLKEMILRCFSWQNTNPAEFCFTGQSTDVDVFMLLSHLLVDSVNVVCATLGLECVC